MCPILSPELCNMERFRFTQEIDLAIVPMVISTVRLIAQDFTQAYYYEPSVLGYKKTKVKSKMGIYAKPFKSNVSTM